ncbi:hypothetical protein ABPG75_007588 [Micractinium tetrahymenae]
MQAEVPPGTTAAQLAAAILQCLQGELAAFSGGLRMELAAVCLDIHQGMRQTCIMDTPRLPDNCRFPNSRACADRFSKLAAGGGAYLEVRCFALLLRLAVQLRDKKLALTALEAVVSANRQLPVLAKPACDMLQHFGWPPRALPLLRQWVAGDAATWDSLCLLPPSSVTLLEAALDAGQTPGLSPGRAQRAQAAATQLAMALAKAARAEAAKQGMRGFFSLPGRLLALLQRVPSAGGRLALEEAALAMLRALGGRAQHLPDFATGCISVLAALAPQHVAGSPVMLKLVCTCLDELSASIGPSPEAPRDWSKPGLYLGYQPTGSLLALKSFLLDPNRRECVLPATVDLRMWFRYVHTHTQDDMDYRLFETDDGLEQYAFTKHHRAHERKLAAHAERLAQQRKLLDLLLPCLVLALPRGGARSGVDGSRRRGRSAKAARLSAAGPGSS